MNASNSSQGTSYMLMGGLLLGTLGVFLEEAGQHSLTAVFFRCLFGAAALWVYALLTKRSVELMPSRKALKIACLTGLLMVAMWASFFAAIGWTSIAVATVVFHIQPVWLIVAAICWYQEPASSRKIIAVASAMLGLVLATGLLDDEVGAWNVQFVWGLLLAIFGSVCYAAVSMIAKQQRALSSLGLTFWQCITGCVLLSWWPVTHGLDSQWLAWAWSTWLWLVGLGVIHTGLAYVLMYAGMQRLEASRIAVLQFAYPISAIALDALIYGRALGVVQWVGVVIMAAALWLISQPAKGQHSTSATRAGV
jgi:drug/metabolite transporter (DMT)-like permease